MMIRSIRNRIGTFGIWKLMAKLGKTLLVVIVGMVLSDDSGNAQSRCPLDSRNDNLATQFVIRGTSIQMPVGAFLLVRKNGEIGAIRLTNIDPAVTEDYGKFTYESYFPSDAAGLFRSGKLVRHEGELDVRPSNGTRGIYCQPGLHKASVGKWPFAFDVPSRMHMSGISFWKEDHGYEFAPTSACSLWEINANGQAASLVPIRPRCKCHPAAVRPTQIGCEVHR
jgi:hypothetical protein